MAVIIRDGIFTLHTANSTYQMKTDEHGVLLHTYYGRHTDETDYSYMIWRMDRGFSGNIEEAGTDRTYSLDYLPQEFPVYGSGDYRVNALQADLGSGVSDCLLFFDSYRIWHGKYALPGLPAMFSGEKDDKEDAVSSLSSVGKTDVVHSLNPAASADGIDTLEIVLKDSREDFYVHLFYGVFEKYDVITRAVVLENRTDHVITVKRLMSACVDFNRSDLEMIHFHGRHAGEREFERTPLGHGITQLRSTRGTSSHQHNPFAIFAEKNTTEESGEAYSFSLLYSGGFSLQAEVDQFSQTRVVMGMDDTDFAWTLMPGTRAECIQEGTLDEVKTDAVMVHSSKCDTDTYSANNICQNRVKNSVKNSGENGSILAGPEVCMCYSDSGLAALSQKLHKAFEKHLIRSIWKNRRRPILVNNWEATYFDFNADKILAIAQEGAKLGLDMLVLDDGWFGKRDSDCSGLGDWYVNEEKLGCTLGEMVDQIHKLGLMFGIWMEPEMVSEDSDLYRQHPDWALAIPGRAPIRGRQQLVLDMSREEVRVYLKERIFTLLDSADIQYIKWDMNRSIAAVYNATLPKEQQGKLRHRYVLGLYELLEEVCTQYPELLIEGCSGGGGRFDAGMLYYTPQIWCSDNTDAIERLHIQYGTSFGYPMSSVSAHVSVCPNHQNGRVTPMKTRGICAMQGTFGYELDLGKLSETEKAVVREQVEFYRTHYTLFQFGKYYRITSPVENRDITAWEYVAENQSEAVLSVVFTDLHANPLPKLIQWKGLAADKQYEVQMDGNPIGIFSGAALMNGGTLLPMPWENYAAFQFYAAVADEEK